MGCAKPRGPHRSGVPGGVDQRDLAHRCQAKLRDENELIADWLVALTTAKTVGGFGLCSLHLRNGSA